MRRFLRDNGLSLTLFACFLGLLFGESLAGLRVFNRDQLEHGEPQVTFVDYVTGSEFLSITMENWESEFLQMAVYVVLTCFLFQRGSSESKDPDGGPADVDRDPRASDHPELAPWPVRKGGLALSLYENSLSLAFVLLFLASGLLHALASRAEFNQVQLEHGEAPVSFGQYLGNAQLWFESLQNWQSEFLAVGAMVVLSIFLRQRGSPESKPVDAPHGQTGD